MLKRCTTFLYKSTTSYQQIWSLQQALHQQQLSGADPRNILIVCQHHLVYTGGRKTKLDQIPDNIEVIRVERGGQITCHAPGQLVFYPLLNLRRFRMDLRWYVSTLEQIIINTLASYDVKAHRHKSYPGVWVASDKIATVGISCSRWLTMHGFALNVNPNLSHFDHIIPCGISREEGYNITSMEKLCKTELLDLQEVTDRILIEFQALFDVQCDIVDANLQTPVLVSNSEPTPDWSLQSRL